MDVTSDGQVLQEVFDFGIDNDALDLQNIDIQPLTDALSLSFADDSIQSLTFANGRPPDLSCADMNLTRVIGLRQSAPQHHVPQMAYCTEPSGVLGYTSPHLNMPLPDSPPESEGSEPYSPPDGHHHNHTQDTKNSLAVNGMSGLQQVQAPATQPHSQTQHMYPPHHRPHPVTKGFTNYLNPNEPLKLNHLPPSTQPPGPPLQDIQHHYIQSPLLPPHYNSGLPPQAPLRPPPLSPQHQQQQQQQQQPAKKRKHSDSPNNTVTASMIGGMNGGISNIKQEPPGYLPDCEDDYSQYDMGETPGSFMDGTYQVIKWQAYQPTKWSNFCDEAYKELPTPSYRVDADKGFNFSVPDDAFVCQKKNHFQVTVQIGIAGYPKYVKTQEGSIKKVDNFFLHFRGIKMESPSQFIKIEQSQSDRSKKAFYPVKIDLTADQFTKLTIGRLHFSETTSNNMRKKGKPNPDQRYFMLVVSLHAHSGDQSLCIASHVSERIIVRASNPGQFEGDVDVLWQKGHTNDSVYHVGRLGVNTDHPDEAVTVHGNIKLTGHIIQPSDVRAKEEIREMDSKEQLRNVSQMRIYKYQYNEGFATQAGIADEERRDTGVIAQEVLEVLPDAVRETGDVMLPNGSRIENFLVVNKDRIFMENVGAVKELCKLTDNLEIRIDELEKMNTKLAKLKRFDSLKSTGSSKSGSSMSTARGGVSSLGRKPKHVKTLPQPTTASGKSWCSNKFIQITIIVLILIMAFCLVSITVLYILERHKTPTTNGSFMQIHNTGHTGQWASSTSPTPAVTSPSTIAATTLTTTPKAIMTTTSEPQLDHKTISGECMGECEDRCCNPPPEDESRTNHVLDPNRTSKSGHVDADVLNPAYGMNTPTPTPTRKIEFGIFNASDVPNVVVNGPEYNVHINNNYLLRRRRRQARARVRREETQSPVVITIQEYNFTLECTQSTEGDSLSTNYTCKAFISRHFNPDTGVTLRFSVDSQYSVSLCGGGSKYLRCLEHMTEEGAQPPFKSTNNQKTLLDWNLKIGAYYKTEYKFRISVSEDPCTLNETNPDPFLEYNIMFQRRPCTSTQHS